MKINKIFLTANLSMLCGTALAGGVVVEEVINEQPVFIASQPYRLMIGGSLLYSQPSTTADLLEYAIIQTINSQTGFIDTQNYAIDDRDYDFGFDVFLRYNFSDTDRDLTLSYLRFSDTDSDNVNYGSIPTNANITSLFNQFYHTAEASVNARLDVIDLLAGQIMHLGETVQLHFIGGLTFARIKQTFDNAYDANLGFMIHGPATSRAMEAYYTYDSQFQGLGPKLGLNADYDILQSGFGLVGGLSIGLLVGSLDHATHISTATAALPSPNFIYQDIDFDTNDVVVTNFDANLGIRYAYDYIDAELGYRINQYTNAVNVTSDFALSSIYLKLATSFFN